MTLGDDGGGGLVWLRVSYSRSLFSGIVIRCANTGFPGATCVHTFGARGIARPHGLHVSAPIDRHGQILALSSPSLSSLPPFSLDFTLSVPFSLSCIMHEFKSLYAAIRCPTSTSRNYQPIRTWRSQLVPVISRGLLTDNAPPKFAKRINTACAVSSGFDCSVD